MLPLEKPCFSETGLVVVNIVMPPVLSVNLFLIKQTTKEGYP